MRDSPLKILDFLYMELVDESLHFLVYLIVADLCYPKEI